jgi:hypothetical protein
MKYIYIYTKFLSKLIKTNRFFWAKILTHGTGRHWYWKKKTTLHTGKKNLRICTLNLFAAEISYLYNMCRVWALKHAIA